MSSKDRRQKSDFLLRDCGKVQLYLGSELLFHSVVVEFSEVKTAANERKLENDLFQPSSGCSFIASVPLDRAKRAFRLDASVDPKQRSVYAVQVVDNFFVYRRQFLIDPNDSVPLRFVTLFSHRTTFAVFALVVFLCASVVVALDRR